MKKHLLNPESQLGNKPDVEVEKVEAIIPPPNSKNKDVSPWAVLREIRYWGYFVLIVGIYNIAFPRVPFALWGIIYLCVGLASFYFRSTVMLMIYGVIWAESSLGFVFLIPTGYKDPLTNYSVGGGIF
jgi:hypothetical protein